MIERARAYRAAAIKDLFRRLFGWIQRRAAVARLQALDDRMLKDMGLNRGEIEAAVRGPGASRPSDARRPDADPPWITSRAGVSAIML